MAKRGRPPGPRVPVCCAHCNEPFEVPPSTVARSTTGRFFCKREHWRLFLAANAGPKTRPGKPVRRGTERAQLAGIAAQYGRDSAEFETAQRDYTALKLEHMILDLLAHDPPLTDAQRHALADQIMSG